MNLNYKKILLFIGIMFIGILQGIPGTSFTWVRSSVAASDYETKYQAFISDARWKNGIAWGGGQVPKLSSWDSSGCCAYCADFEKYVYGTQGWSGTPFYSVSEIKTGDILHVSPEHWFVVLSRNGNSLYTAEGNCGSVVVVSSSRYTISGNYITYQSKNGPASYSLSVGYHFNTGVVSPTPVTTTWSNKTERVTETNAVLGITYNAGSSKYFGYVGLYVNGQYACGYEPGKTLSSYTFSFDLNKDAGIILQPGQKYTYQFYVNTMSGDIFGDEYSFTTPKGDNEKPVITNAKVIDLDSTGYTVQCKVTDNIGVDRVQCPTWTKAGDQDDIAKDWGTNTAVKATHKGNGIYEFRVKISDHNNEYGYYHTHIYAYDKSGNQSNSVALNYINVLMGDTVDIGDELYTFLKLNEGGYCFSLYSSGSGDTAYKYFEVSPQIYDHWSYSSYVYRFAHMENNDYKLYHFNADLGTYNIVDDGTNKGLLLVKKGTNQVWKYDGDKKQVKLSNYVKNDKNQYFELENVIKRDKNQYIADYCAKYDGTPKSFDDTVDVDYCKYYYKLTKDGEWSNIKPTRTEVGTTKVYYKIESPCYNDNYGIASISVVQDDNCLIKIDEWEEGLSSVFSCKYARGFIIRTKVKNTTTFSSYSIVTSVIENGKLYTDKKEYGPVVIEPEKDGRVVFVEPAKFNNAGGEYTTTISLTTVNGEKYERSIQYDFENFKDATVKKLKLNDVCVFSGFNRLFNRNADFNTGEVEISYDENEKSFSVVGKKVGRVYLVGFDDFLRRTTIIIDVTDEYSSGNPNDDPIDNPKDDSDDNPNDNTTKDDPVSETTYIKLQAEVNNKKINFTWNVPDKDATYGIVYALDEQELDIAEANNGYEVSGLKASGDTMTYDCPTTVYENQPGGVWFRVVMKNGDEVKHSNAVKITNWSDTNPNEDLSDKSDNNSSGKSADGQGDEQGNNPTDTPSGKDSGTDDSSQNSNNTDSNVTNSKKITLSALTVTKATPSTNQITFTWSGDASATGYEIEYSVNTDLSNSQKAYWNKHSLKYYRLTDLNENTTYYYRLRAYKGEGAEREYSEWTSVASVQTQTKDVTTESPAKQTYSAPKITLKSVKNNKKKTMVVKWKWNVKADGYQISYAKKKNFSGAKKKNVNAYKDSVTIKNLTKGKTYFVKIRSFVKADTGDKVYGKWSRVKKVKIKK